MARGREARRNSRHILDYLSIDDTPLRREAATTAPTDLPQQAFSLPSRLQTGPTSDTFTAGNPLFIGALAKEETLISFAGSTPTGSTPAGDSQGNMGDLYGPPLDEAGKKAVTTLLENGNFAKIASSADGKDILTLEEAQKWLSSLKTHPDGAVTPFPGSVYQSMIDALTYITTDGHFEQLAGEDKEISKDELQKALDKAGGPDKPDPGPTVTDEQQQASDALRTLTLGDERVRNAVLRGGIAGQQDGLISRNGVKQLAEVSLDDDVVWGDVPKEMRAEAQKAAKTLMGPAASAFDGMLRKEGDPDSMTINEAADFVVYPDSIPSYTQEDAAKDFDAITDIAEKHKQAMEILSQNKDLIDKASSSDGTTDGNFNIRDFYNLAKSNDAPALVKAAAKFVSSDDGLLRDIDGLLDSDHGYSNGNFSWDGDFMRALNDARNPNFNFTGYDDDIKKPIFGIDLSLKDKYKKHQH